MYNMWNHLSWFTFKTIYQIILCSAKKSLTPNQKEHQSVKQTIKEKSAKNYVCGPNQKIRKESRQRACCQCVGTHKSDSQYADWAIKIPDLLVSIRGHSIFALTDLTLQYIHVLSPAEPWNYFVDMHKIASLKPLKLLRK